MLTGDNNKSIKIGHFSDLHSNLSVLRNNKAVPDIWFNTGDFFPDYWVSREQNEKIQVDWFQANKAFLTSMEECFYGKPVVWMPGNHDFVSFYGLMKQAGYPNILEGNQLNEFHGLRISGIRGVLYINGMYNHEIQEKEFSVRMVEMIERDNPDIILTHGPCAGILDNGYGSSAMTNAFNYLNHNIKYHFFGHVHECNGTREVGGTKFINSATSLRFVDIPVP